MTTTSAGSARHVANTVGAMDPEGAINGVNVVITDLIAVGTGVVGVASKTAMIMVHRAVEVRWE